MCIMYALPTISKLTRKIFETWELGIKVFKIKKGEKLVSCMPYANFTSENILRSGNVSHRRDG